MQAVVGLEMLQNVLEVLPADRHLVLGQGKRENFVRRTLVPPPAVEPGERIPLGGAVELSQDQTAMAIIVSKTTRFRRREDFSNRKVAGTRLRGIIGTGLEGLDGHTEWGR